MLRVPTLARLAVPLALLLGAGAAEAAPPLRPVEPPPLRYASGPTQYGETRERTFADPADLQAFCNFYLGRPVGGTYEACYVPALDLVVLPTPEAAASPERWRALRAHEWAHARGWRHEVLSTASAAAKRP